jgi:hypothetical protein
MKKQDNTAIERVQAMANRSRVNAWLTHIGEHDNAIRDSVLEDCATNPESRIYYLERHRTMGQHDKGRI